jgi:predicted nuclease of predicted toxin-antitoxin system
VGHDAWTAAEAGLAQADDDDLTVYAAQRSAIVVTHDNEFSDRRIKNGIHGKHVWLRCLEFDAARVLVRDLPNVAAVLSSPRDVLVELHLNSPPKIHRGVRKAR